MVNDESVEYRLLAKASGRGMPGVEPPIPRGMPRGEMKADSSESGD